MTILNSQGLDTFLGSWGKLGKISPIGLIGVIGQLLKLEIKIFTQLTNCHNQNNFLN